MSGRCCRWSAWCWLALAACDPVLDNAVAALGDEVSGVRPGPMHRPGQPCLLCHDGSFGSPLEFSVAGTVFETSESRSGADRVVVEIMAADGASFTAQTNAAGNFYVSAERWSPEFPLLVKLVYQDKTIEMTSKIGRDGSCGGCHSDPAGPASPGHVYLVAVTPDTEVP